VIIFCYWTKKIYSLLSNVSHVFHPEIKVQNDHVNLIFCTETVMPHGQSTFLQCTHSINNPGYQDDNLKISLANIHFHKQIHVWHSIFLQFLLPI